MYEHVIMALWHYGPQMVDFRAANLVVAPPVAASHQHGHMTRPWCQPVILVCIPRMNQTGQSGLYYGIR